MSDDTEDIAIDEEDFVGPAQATTEDLTQVQNALKLKDDSDEEREVLEEEKTLITNDNEGVDKETLDLYDEFSEFLVKKADIVETQSAKKTMTTTIDILDAILGGGFVIGGMNIIAGASGSGKSMLVMQSIGGGQIQYKNLIAAYLDSEEATTTQRLSNLGVTRPKIKPVTDVTVEKVFKLLEAMCVFKETKGLIDTPSAIVWDSIANTLSMKEREAEDINSVIGYKARLLSILVPKYVQKCATYNIAWIAVNQLRDKLALGGPYNQPAKELNFFSQGKNMPGGTVLKFNAFNLLEMKHSGALKAEKFGFEGIQSKVKTVKSKLFSPNHEITLIGSFVHGFSNFWTNYNFLVDHKRLKSGSWNYLISYPSKKFRTKDAEKEYNTDPDFKVAWDAAVKEAIDTEIISKG